MRTNSLVFLLIALAAAPLGAQANRPADAAAITQSRQTAAATFLDRNRSDAERLAAAARMGFPDDRTAAALLAIGVDRSQSDAIRFEALQRVPFSFPWLDAVLKILDDPNDGGEELDANLIVEMNRTVTFRPPAAVRQRMFAVLRKLMNDRRDKVRLNAFRALVTNHDQVAVNVLADSLRRGTSLPLPLAEIINLIDQDGSANHIGAIRPYLDHGDAEVQAKAVRALALDPESRPRIVRLAVNPQAPQVVRVNALRGLAREDGKFGSYAIPLVENPRENGDVRYVAMHAFAGRMNYAQVDGPEQVRFAQAVERIAEDANLRSNAAEKIRREARELHEYLRKAFPEVAKFYAGKP